MPSDPLTHADRLANITSIHPSGVLFLILAAIFMFLLPRNKCGILIFITACYLAYTQRLVIFGLDFTMLRLVIVLGWLRILVRGEVSFRNLNVIDKLVIWWTVSATLTFSLYYLTPQALTVKLGEAFDILGIYFLFRMVIRSEAEVNALIRALAFVIIPLAFLVYFESTNQVNLLLDTTPSIRDGAVRCQGPFRHPILAGTFGASNIPLILGSIWMSKGLFRKVFLIPGLTASVLILVYSHSSGPIMAIGAGLCALLLWPARRRMRMIRWIIVFGLVGLDLIMKAPIWYFPHLIGLLSGHAWHRANLIDKTINHFSEWFLLGTDSVSRWGIYMGDVTCFYVEQAVRGGLLTLVLFCALLVYCFRHWD